MNIRNNNADIKNKELELDEKDRKRQEIMKKLNLRTTLILM